MISKSNKPVNVEHQNGRTCVSKQNIPCVRVMYINISNYTWLLLTFMKSWQLDVSLSYHERVLIDTLVDLSFLYFLFSKRT